MEWFKHKTDMHDDPVISAAMDEYGDAAYVVWCVLLELYGRQYKAQKPNNPYRVNKVYLARKFRKRWTKVSLILNYYAGFNKLSLTEGEKHVVIRIDNFTNILSNWSKRQLSKPTEVPTEAPTAIEKEKEKEEDTDKSTARASSPADLEIKTLADSIYKAGIWKKVHAWVATAIKGRQNRDAILHVLQRVWQMKKLTNGDGNWWAYCTRIIQAENGNYNEREYVAKAQEQKMALNEFLGDIGKV